MKHIGWFIIIWAMLLGFSLQLKAQHISVSAPTHVAAGENFRVAYTINTRDVEEFRLGGVGEGLEVIAGPYTSSQSSYQMINGHTSSSSSVTITYTLYAAKNGTFGIGASHAIVMVRNSLPIRLRLRFLAMLHATTAHLPCTDRMIMMNHACEQPDPEYQAATSSSRLQPTSDVFTNRNRCSLLIRFTRR